MQMSQAHERPRLLVLDLLEILRQEREGRASRTVGCVSPYAVRRVPRHRDATVNRLPESVMHAPSCRGLLLHFGGKHHCDDAVVVHRCRHLRDDPRHSVPQQRVSDAGDAFRDRIVPRPIRKRIVTDSKATTRLYSVTGTSRRAPSSELSRSPRSSVSGSTVTLSGRPSFCAIERTR